MEQEKQQWRSYLTAEYTTTHDAIGHLRGKIRDDVGSHGAVMVALLGAKLESARYFLMDLKIVTTVAWVG
jgi:hypothetical protein